LRRDEEKSFRKLDATRLSKLSTLTLLEGERTSRKFWGEGPF